MGGKKEDIVKRGGTSVKEMGLCNTRPILGRSVNLDGCKKAGGAQDRRKARPETVEKRGKTAASLSNQEAMFGRGPGGRRSPPI